MKLILIVSPNLIESQLKAFLYKDFSFLLWNDDWNVRITTCTLRGSYKISTRKKTHLKGKIQSWLSKVGWNSTPDPFLTPTLWNQFGEEGDYDVTSETLWHTFTLIWSFARNPLKIQIGFINLEKLLLRESWQLSMNKTFCKIPIIGCVARVIRQRSIDYCMGQMLQYNL